ncbi:oxysterol binding family protein [Tieghemostelium lacteum]|uniref:Oxysterol binding family protein n=1 Tax=Tieghemostelium lacteum TaxID=361077 RepID=A0A151ZSH7_TIELA|nr:oxysterol binding family protein [Tieghemostelium lacteum]|eukprot:KYQ96866.1 oxysterol binding family protein [Tieghemostelium lacteum]
MSLSTSGGSSNIKSIPFTTTLNSSNSNNKMSINDSYNSTSLNGNGKEIQSKIFRQNSRHPQGGWKFIDSEELKKQRGVCWELVKSVGNSIVEGKELVNTCLPISLFEPRSFLEKLTDTFAYASFYLNKAAECTDPLERMKLIISFCISGLHLTSTLTKPFNPLLSETFQGRIGDDISVYCEQTSHHPPISSWEVVGRKFHYYGYGQWSASCLGNIVKGYQRGPHVIEFADGGKITWNLPDILIKGIFFGDRVTEFSGKTLFTDEANKLVCELKFNPHSLGFFKSLISKQKEPSDTFIGNIYKVSGDNLTSSSSSISSKKDKEKYSEDDIVAKIDGTWLTQLNIGGNVYWNLKMVPTGILYEEDPLPSDSRFRLDLKYLKEGDIEKAKMYKAQLEDKQRAEAKSRKESLKKK